MLKKALVAAVAVGSIGFGGANIVHADDVPLRSDSTEVREKQSFCHSQLSCYLMGPLCDAIDGDWVPTANGHFACYY